MSSTLTATASPPRQGLGPLVIACLAATWLIWGSTYLAIKFALPSFPPFLQMGSRFITAGVLLMAWMRLARRAPWPTRAQWRNAFIVGTLMLGGGMGGTAYAEQSVGSGLVVAFIAIVPVLMVALNAALGTHPSRSEMAGIAVGVGGVLLLTQGAGFRASPVGLFAIATACVTWCVGSVMSQRHFTLAPGAVGFASEMICGGLVLMLLASLDGEYAKQAALWPPHPTAVAAWFYLVVAGSLIAFNAYMLLLTKASPALASSYCFVNPVIAMLLGVTLGGETITGYEWLAAAVVVSGVVLLLRGKG
ncbi:MAG TPA: EamA family transporter [Burkholderiaceae bacterium]|jgi:drug/metabolite transporter (DMT)-like permease|nr:EamA family transporter [Burkholderiaceae bacterium]